ncbi:hypothetical protein [Saccharothrix sp. NRRL B-16314]|uniref:hypothetical protein n=1 Tax=Saccharothrix sp. NRRL B-16314 TaxID=1463825 RepID=UPI000525C658|nr:hypothetical protein [Saccharothrix sp. NRRL B-16314]
MPVCSAVHTITGDGRSVASKCSISRRSRSARYWSDRVRASASSATASARRARFAFHAVTRSTLHTTAFGLLALSISTMVATLTKRSCWRMASLSALRSVARMRCLLAGPTARRFFTAARSESVPVARISAMRRFSASIASNMSDTCATRSLSSGSGPRCGTR